MILKFDSSLSRLIRHICLINLRLLINLPVLSDKISQLLPSLLLLVLPLLQPLLSHIQIHRFLVHVLFLS